MTGNGLRAAGLVLLSGLALALGGCGGESEAPTRPTAAPERTAAPPAQAKAGAADQAEQIFETRCATCHGPDGSGSGPASQGLAPPPRDLRDPAWQTSVSDEHIANIVKYGGAAVGKSPTMPGNPDLTGKPDIVAALVTKIRQLKTP